MIQPTISIIIPVYNVAPYLNRCIESVLGQSYSSLEVILIDDGSVDESAKMCDQFVQRDTRIRVLHQKNCGVSAARNAGLSVATGEYITFVDPDDWLECDMYETLIATLENSNAQAAFCGYWEKPEIEENAVTIMHSPKKVGIVSGQEALYQCLIGIGKGYFTSVWNKVFRRNAILQPDGSLPQFSSEYQIGEDEVWLVEVVPKLKHVALINSPFYNWMQRPSSALHELSVSSRWYTALTAKRRCAKLAKDFIDDTFHIHTLTLAKIYNDMFHVVWLAYVTEDRLAKNYFRTELKEYRRIFFQSREFSVWKKIRFALLDWMVCWHFPKNWVMFLGNQTRTIHKERLKRLLSHKKWRYFVCHCVEIKG